MTRVLFGFAALCSVSIGCSAGGTTLDSGGAGGTGGGVGAGGSKAGPGGASAVGGGTATGGGGGAGGSKCGSCSLGSYVSCDSGSPVTIPCGNGCVPDKGCTACTVGVDLCVGNEVHSCNPDGTVGGVVTTCPAAQICVNGACGDACAAAVAQPSNVGCEFWAADLDLSDISDPSFQPWGLVIANAGLIPADVVIEKNDAPVGMPLQISMVNQGTLMPGQLGVLKPPISILDCGPKIADHYAPGTCLSSHAFRVRSTAPVVVYQFNTLDAAFTTDASLLLPTTSLGTKYRVIGWPSAHSDPEPGTWPQRAYITIIGTQPNTQVKVKAAWKIKGNPPIAATATGGTLTATIGPFDVLNLEGDETTFQEVFAAMKPPYPSDMTGSIVESTAPVVVFSGTESSGVGLPTGAPVPLDCQPDPMDPNKGASCHCCLQHLEEQLPPLSALGKKYVVTRSPIRSAPDSNYIEPDVIRFVGAAEPSAITTTLPAPFDAFTLQPGEIRDTWTQTDFIATGSTPFIIGQYLIAGGYAQPNPTGDPSFTVFPTVEQAQAEYVFLSPTGWTAWVVISAPTGTNVMVDGAPPSACTIAPAGMLDGKAYEARRCKLPTGVHRLTGDGPFGIMAYGYAGADAYSFPGGASLKKIYDVPNLQLPRAHTVIRLLDLPHDEARALAATGVPVHVFVNPVEYHGPHLSLHNDRLVSEGLALDFARLRGETLVALDDLEIGVEPCPGPGTRRTLLPAARAIVREACRALVELGARRVVFGTFHGAPLHAMAIEEGVRLLREAGVEAFSPFNLVVRELVEAGDPARFAEAVAHLDPADRRAALDGLALDFHAGFFETSVALHYAPQSVSALHRELPPCPPVRAKRRFRLASRAFAALGKDAIARDLAFAAVGVGWHAMRPFPGYTGAPHLANAASGAVFARLIVERYVEHGQRVLAGLAPSPPPIMAWSAAASLGGRIGLGAPAAVHEMLSFTPRG